MRRGGVKLSFSSEFLMPDVALLDPLMTVTMPPRLTALSGLDAFSHALEAYISIQSNPISKSLSSESLKIIWRTLPDVVRNPSERLLRQRMMDASLIAGMAFSNAMVGIIHSMAHALGSVLHVPHGLSVSMFIVPGLKDNLEASGKALAELLSVVEPSRYHDEGAYEFVRLVDGFIREIKLFSGIPARLRDLGVEDKHVSSLVEKAMGDGSSIFSHVNLTPDRAERMIREAL